MDLIMDLSAARLELEKLQADLQISENHLKESAEKGLALLEAKSDLEERYELLENEMDRLRNERDSLKKALEKTNTIRKEFVDIEVEHEKDLLQEKVLAEELFTSQIHILESENRNMKVEFERSSGEIKKLQEWVRSLGDDNDQQRRSHEKLHKEILEHRLTEKVMATENEELHTDNVHLRKHVAILEMRTKECEGLKFETRKLAEDKELLLNELEETRRLTDIVKQQAEEAWKSLENERELRRTLQRQVNDQNEDRDRWNRMASLRLEVDDDGDSSYDDSGSAVVPFSQPDNLFAELQKSSVEQDAQIVSEMESCKQRMNQIFKIIGALELLAAGTLQPDLKNSIFSASAEIRGLCQNLGGSSGEHSAFLEDIHAQLNKRNDRQATLDAKITALLATVETLCEILAEKQLCINTCYDSLRSLRGTLSMNSCPGSGSGMEPSGPSQDGSSSPSQQPPSKKSNKLEEEIRSRIRYADIAIPEIVSIDVAADSDAFVGAFEDLKRHCQEILASSSPNRALKDGAEENSVEQQEQLSRLKAHLGRKRDENALLKEALHNTQQTAEKAMASLKLKYEHEKEASGRTLVQLRKELNQRKEDAATFASIRSMLSERNDDYCTQLENLQRQLRSAEEERRTLNSLLRMAIQQKLNLIHRVEDLECVLDGQQTQTRRREPRPNRSLFRGRGRPNESPRYPN